MGKKATQSEYKQISIFQYMYNSAVDQRNNPQTKTAVASDAKKQGFKTLNTASKKKTVNKKAEDSMDGIGALLTAILSPKPLSVEQAFYKWEHGTLKGYKLTDRDTEDMIKIRESHIKINAAGEEVKEIASWREIGEMYGIGASAVLKRVEYYYRKKNGQQPVPEKSDAHKKLQTVM